jgi:hypothetical protein
MSKTKDGYRDCPKCGLHRRPDDNILMREDTNFRILNRNVARSPKGTEVEIVEASAGLKGTYGHLKTDGPVYALRSKPGFIIGTSRDEDDLILLIACHGWCIEDPDIANIVDSIKT